MTDQPTQPHAADLAELRTALRSVAPISASATERTLAAVRIALALRRRRTQVAGGFGDLFGDPAWDALLVLFIADCEGRTLAIEALGVAMQVSPSVAGRWIELMARRGLLVIAGMTAEPARRRARLTPGARELVIRSFEPLVREMG
jgi:hypothetical protein